MQHLLLRRLPEVTQNLLLQDYDELQTIARDSRTLFTSGMTNGELVASSINKIVAGIRKAGYTDVRPVFWDDMLNPYKVLPARNTTPDHQPRARL